MFGGGIRCLDKSMSVTDLFKTHKYQQYIQIQCFKINRIVYLSELSCEYATGGWGYGRGGGYCFMCFCVFKFILYHRKELGAA